MNGCQYEAWSAFYDNQQVELREIKKALSDASSSNVFKGKKVLEIGCGTGRFTFKILKDIESLLAIDPDSQRIEILNEKLKSSEYNSKCTTHIGTLEELYKKNIIFDKFDLIFFSWSWAFITNAEEIIDLSLNLLKDDGKIIITMVVDGDFENLIYELNTATGRKIQNELERNRTKIQDLRILLSTRLVWVKEFEISTFFEFNNVAEAKKFVGYSVDERVIDKEIYNSLIQFVDYRTNTVRISDIVASLCISRLTKNEISNPAKITFNYKKCDNRGECSAEKICRTHRSAILRNRTKNIWVVDRRKCDECGKCRSVCELFNIHSSNAELFEKLREIEDMTIEPEFFDKDRYGSGSYHPAHKILSFEELKSIFKHRDDLLIIEIDDGARLTSSFDSILVSDIIPKSYYDKYFYKYIIPRSNDEVAGEVQVKKRDIQHEELCSTVMQTFGLNELPALVFIWEGKVKEKIEGIFRLVDHDRCEQFIRDIETYINRWEAMLNQ